MTTREVLEGVHPECCAMCSGHIVSAEMYTLAPDGITLLRRAPSMALPGDQQLPFAESVPRG